MSSPAALAPSRRPEYWQARNRANAAALRRYPTVPLRVGGWCVYRGQVDLRLMRVLGISGGVAKLGRDGATFDEPVVKVRGVRVEDER